MKMHSSVNTLCLESLTQKETYTFDTCVKVRKKWAEIFIRIIIFQKSSHLSIDLVSVGGVVPHPTFTLQAFKLLRKSLAGVQLIQTTSFWQYRTLNNGYRQLKVNKRWHRLVLRVKISSDSLWRQIHHWNCSWDGCLSCFSTQQVVKSIKIRN